MPNYPKTRRNKLLPKRPKHHRVTKTKFYHSPAWRKLRQIHLSENPYCVECIKKGKNTAANTVDHIKPINRNDPFNTMAGMYGDPLDPENLQSMCEKCHNSKSGREAHGYHG